MKRERMGMQDQIVSMSKRKFRIGDLAQELKIKKYIIRFWEKEFDLKSDRSDGGQRFYTEDDLALFVKIKQLLYKEGFTIAGARKQLGINDSTSTSQLISQNENKIAFSMQERFSGATESSLTTESGDSIVPARVNEEFLEKHDQIKQQMMLFKEKLLQFRDMLEKK